MFDLNSILQITFLLKLQPLYGQSTSRVLKCDITIIWCVSRKNYDVQSSGVINNKINFELRVRRTYRFFASIVMTNYLLLGSTSSWPTKIWDHSAYNIYAIFADFAHVGLKYEKVFLRKFFVNLEVIKFPSFPRILCM